MTTDKPSAYLYKETSPSTAKTIEKATGVWLHLTNGQKIMDATCGAAVSALGHGNERVNKAIAGQLEKVAYCHPGFYQTETARELADFLVNTTNGRMAKTLITGSGSEAVEASMKLARQYFLELSPPQSERCHFIARKGSWHGCTIATLAVGDFKPRKTMFESILPANVSRVSACNPYRDLLPGETIPEYVKRLAEELDAEFQRVGPRRVCAFIAEPVVGSALGCVAPVQGYFKAIKEVTDRYGALLIFDEVMCGMGRTGTMHAWEQEGVVPHIQAIGKTLGAGFIPISAVLVHEKVVSVFNKGSKYFAHGQTYQSHPTACAAALEVQKIVQENNLVKNVQVMGKYLGAYLRERLGAHPNVGDIRGRGLFWAIEFVENKETKTPLDPSLKIATKLHNMGMTPGYDIALFHATGSAGDGLEGDHILICPPYIIGRREVEEIVDRVDRVVNAVFDGLNQGKGERRYPYKRQR